MTARRVVVAAGIRCFRTIPATLQHLGREFVTHSSDHHDLGNLRGGNVVVFGAGASAIDTAALLHEAGVQFNWSRASPLFSFTVVAGPMDSGRCGKSSVIRAAGSGLDCVPVSIARRPCCFICFQKASACTSCNAPSVRLAVGL